MVNPNALIEALAMERPGQPAYKPPGEATPTYYKKIYHVLFTKYYVSITYGCDDIEFIGK